MSTTYITKTIHPNGSRLIHVLTAGGEYPVEVAHRSQEPVTTTNQDGTETTTFQEISWEATCDNVARQVQASLGAPVGT